MASWLDIYTDGACIGNPGPGGYAAVIVERPEYEAKQIVQGGERVTTNNRMEMRAVIEALKAIPARSQVRIVTDSQYVKRGYTEWLPRWRARDFKTSTKKPVKNLDLWQALDVAVARHFEVTWKWIRGHGENKWNEMADLHAVAEAKRQAS